MKTVRPVIPIFLFLLLSSCTTIQYHGIEPISPKPGWIPFKPSSVDSLQPTFLWNCVDPGEIKYDIIIYKGAIKYVGDYLTSPSYYVPGAEVYYREGIQNCSHHIEQRLERDTVYVWSVRTHSDIKVEAWSTYDFQQGFLPGRIFRTNQGTNFWCPFVTP